MNTPMLLKLKEIVEGTPHIEKGFRSGLAPIAPYSDVPHFFNMSVEYAKTNWGNRK